MTEPLGVAESPVFDMEVEDESIARNTTLNDVGYGERLRRFLELNTEEREVHHDMQRCGIERPTRMIVGFALLAIAAFAALPASLMIVLYAIGVVAVVTGAIGFCSAWGLLGSIPVR